MTIKSNTRTAQRSQAILALMPYQAERKSILNASVWETQMKSSMMMTKTIVQKRMVLVMEGGPSLGVPRPLAGWLRAKGGQVEGC
jgi:hypothetical protein